MSRLIRVRSNCSNIAGFYPAYSCNSSINVGTILGTHLDSNIKIYFDPIVGYRNNLLNNPSLFVLGEPGLGKSSLISRLILGTVSRGDIPIIMGDLKGEYIDIIKYVGGTIIDFTKGINLLSIVHNSHPSIKDTIIDKLKELIIILVSIHNKDKIIGGLDISILNKAVEILCHNNKSTISDILNILYYPSESLLELSLCDNLEKYRIRISTLREAVKAFLEATKKVFNNKNEMKYDEYKALCIDVSSVIAEQKVLVSSLMLSAWFLSASYVENIQTINSYKNKENEPNRWCCAIFDELWRTLQGSSSDLVDRINELTRLNRKKGIAEIFITHTLKDLIMKDKSDSNNAEGFIERVGAIACAGLPMKEFQNLGSIINYSDVEVERITNWVSTSTHSNNSKLNISPGRGKFMLKIGNNPGIPFQLILSQQEIDLHMTDIHK